MGKAKKVKAQTIKKAKLINTEDLEKSLKTVSETKTTEETSKTPAKAQKALKAKRESIYTDSVMEGLTSLQKKQKRRELRHKLASYVSSYDKAVKEKNDKAVKEIQTDWAKYAKATYRDITKLFEANTAEENQAAYTRFLKAMTK